MIPNFHLKQQMYRIKMNASRSREAFVYRIDSVVYNEFILVTVWNFLLTQQSQN